MTYHMSRDNNSYYVCLSALLFALFDVSCEFDGFWALICFHICFRGVTALHLAAEHGHLAICEYLLRNKVMY